MAGGLIEEDDGDSGEEYSPSDRQSDLPEGLARGGRSEAPPPGRHPPAEDFVILDDEGDALVPPAREDNLAEEADTYVGRQEAARKVEARKSRRERQREGRSRTEAQVAFLQQQLEALQEQLGSVQPKFAQIDEAHQRQQLDGVTRQLQEQANIAAQARKAISEAMVSGNTDELNAALDRRDNAFLAANRLAVQKQALEKGLQEVEQVRARQPEPARQAPPPLPREVASRINDFQSDFPWYNPNNPRDTDSRVVLQLDSSVAADGFDPRTQDYWEELEDRMKRYLPHRFEEEVRQGPKAPARSAQARTEAAPPARRGPPVAPPSQSRQPQAGRTEVRLTRERKEALVNASVIDRDGNVLNKDKFSRILKGYQEFDRESNPGRRAGG